MKTRCGALPTRLHRRSLRISERWKTSRPQDSCTYADGQRRRLNGPPRRVSSWCRSPPASGLAFAHVLIEPLDRARPCLLRRSLVVRRCCTNRPWPARCPPTGSSPADAIRHWSTEGGHTIQDLTAEDGLTPLPGWAPGAKAIADDGLVAEERILHPALTMVP